MERARSALALVEAAPTRRYYPERSRPTPQDGSALLQRGEAADARPLLERQRGHARRPRADEPVADARLALAACLHALGEPAQAAELERSAQGRDSQQPLRPRFRRRQACGVPRRSARGFRPILRGVAGSAPVSRPFRHRPCSALAARDAPARRKRSTASRCGPRRWPQRSCRRVAGRSGAERSTARSRPTCAPRATLGILDSRADRRGPRRLVGRRLVPVHHRARSVPRGPPRATAVPAQVHRRRRARPADPATGGGDLDTNLALGAGLADSCAACHGRPHGLGRLRRRSSRPGPTAATRRTCSALGLKEMLGRRDHGRAARDPRAGRRRCAAAGTTCAASLVGKWIRYGTLTARRTARSTRHGVRGVDADLRVRPFFAHGGTISIREFVGRGVERRDGPAGGRPRPRAGGAGGRVTTPCGHGARRHAGRDRRAPTRRAPRTIRTATGWSTRFRRASSTTSSSTC